MDKMMLTFLGLLILVGGCSTIAEKKITENSVVTLKNYGAFSPIDMATQILTIDKYNTTLRYYGPEGTMTKEYLLKTDMAKFQELIGKLQENKFTEMEGFYTMKEGQPAVTDVGTGEITVEDGEVKKTVKIDPYFEDYMPDSLKEINSMLDSFRMDIFSTTEAEANKVAEDFIKGSKTYMNGGSGLKLTDYLAEESYPVRHILTYEFSSSHAGYGENKIAAQVITEHTIVVTVFMKEVIDAVIDGKWDEISQAEISDPAGEEYKYFIYQPKQCEVLPWMKWKEESLIMWAKEPTEEEVASAYFINIDVDAKNFLKIDSGKMACEACDICPTSYYYQVESKTAGKLLELGWTESSGPSCKTDSECKTYCFEKGNSGVISYQAACKNSACECTCPGGRCD